MLDILSTTTYNCIVASLYIKVNTYNKKLAHYCASLFIFCILLFFLWYFYIIICRDGREQIKS